MNTVCGIQPAAPHFEEIIIAPNPGGLRSISGEMPHPKGEIEVDFSFKNNSVSGEVYIPEGVKAILYWKEKEVPLVSGKNKIRL